MNAHDLHTNMDVDAGEEAQDDGLRVQVRAGPGCAGAQVSECACAQGLGCI